MEQLKIGEWSFVTAVLRGNTGYIYINSQESAKGEMFKPSNVTRVTNYIGTSDLTGPSCTNAVIDDLKIFNRALDINEIEVLMNEK